MMNYHKKFALLIIARNLIFLFVLRASSSYPLLVVVNRRTIHKRIRHAGGSPTTTSTYLATAVNTQSTSPEQEQSPESGGSSRRRRRPRYSGKYPRNFSEKYKEHERDAATMEKVLNKGMTPAGTHVPIMLSECLEYLGLIVVPPHRPQQQQQQPALHDSREHRRDVLVAVDCTLGYGGHAEHILQALAKMDSGGGGGVGRLLFGFDQDSIEIVKTTERLRQQQQQQQQQMTSLGDATSNKNVEFIPVNQNFATIKSYLQQQQQPRMLLGQVTCLLADLGLSSMQIDDSQRGFTYKRDGPLDMRMNPNDDKSRETAHQLLQRLKPRELQRLLEENSDEVYAKEIAVGLLGAGGGGSNKKKNDDVIVIPKTTLELANRVRDIVHPFLLEQQNFKKHDLKHTLDSTVARTMQAIRIEVNGEFQALEQLLDDLPDILAPGGRAVFLTFHSGEDRRVKKAFKQGFKNGTYSSWSRDVVRPSSLERRNNPRSSCCKLRWVVKQQQVQE